MVKCPNRNKDTLIRLICENVADGSTIYTDGWRSYRTLGEINGYKVNINHPHEGIGVALNGLTGSLRRVFVLVSVACSGVKPGTNL